MSNFAAHLTRPVPTHLAERLHAAADDLADAGFGDLGMREIARITGIPRATLYYHFASKDDLISFLLRVMLEDLRLAVAAAVDRSSSVDDRVRCVIEAQFGHLAANPSLGRMLLVNLGKVERLRMLGDGIEAGFRAPVRSLLDEAVAEGIVGPIDVDVVVTALYGAITLLGFDSLLRLGAIDAPALTRTVFTTFWSGIAEGAA